MTQPSLERVTQPFGSKILLTKDGNSLEILLPRMRFTTDIVLGLTFVIAWNSSFLAMWTGITVFATPFPINYLLCTILITFWGAGIISVLQILSTLFGRVRLRLDQQQISQTYEMFGFKYKHQRPAPRKRISKLELECISNYKHRITIWAGTQKYELGGYGHITEPELQWLNYELSDWLRVPIKR